MTALYSMGSVLFEGAFKALGIQVRSVGHENIPASGPAILAANHISYLDFCFVMLAPPRPRREVRFLARSEFFDQPVVGPALRGLRQIPVDVHGDPTQAAAVAREALDRGELIGIHPEGTINPSFAPRRGKSGTVRLADQAEAPIIPVAVWGSHRLLTKDRRPSFLRRVVVTVRYGEPVVLRARTGMARTRELIDAINQLVARSQAGYPQRPAPPPANWWIPAHLGGSAPTIEEAERRLREQTDARRAQREAASTAITEVTERP